MEQESIIKSTFRSFFKVLAGFIAFFIVLFFFFGIAASQVSSPIQQEKYTVSILPDAEGKKSTRLEDVPGILRIDIQGVIGARKMTAKDIQNQLQAFDSGILKNRKIGAILLYIDSPGGLSTDSDEIYRLLNQYKEKWNVPLYAYVNGMCASGGMYIACSADEIYAAPTGIIGSVGVRLGPVLNYSGLMDRYGVSALTLTEGKYKDMLNPTKPFDPQSYASIKETIEYEYDRFITIVSNSRKKLTKSKLRNELGAQVYSPLKAQQLGYVDNGKASYNEALKALAEKANLKKYQVLQVHVLYPIFKDLIEGESSWIKNCIFPGSELMGPKFSSHILYLYQP